MVGAKGPRLRARDASAVLMRAIRRGVPFVRLGGGSRLVLAGPGSAAINLSTDGGHAGAAAEAAWLTRRSRAGRGANAGGEAHGKPFPHSALPPIPEVAHGSVRSESPPSCELLCATLRLP